MQTTVSERIRRFAGGTEREVDDLLVVEQTADLMLNGERLLGLRCLPGDLESLAVGFLLTDGLLRTRKELISVEVDDSGRTISVVAEIPRERLGALSTRSRIATGCGRGISVDNLDDELECDRPFNFILHVRAADLMSLSGRFARASKLYRSAGGVHSAALSGGQELEYFADDVARHNAVDRVVGQAFLAGHDVSRMILLTTGRLTFEMVSKAARMRIPIALSLSSATHEAVELARRFHVTLCGRVRARRMNVYSGEWRIE